MNDDDVIAEIEVRHRQTADVLDSGLYYPNVARIHADRAALLAIVKKQKQEIESARADADRLAIDIKLAHFREVATDWRPLPDTRGILSQISNMVAGLGAREAALQEIGKSALLVLLGAKFAGDWPQNMNRDFDFVIDGLRKALAGGPT